MIPTDKKIVEVIAPAAIVDNAAFTTKLIDTLGFRFCEIFLHLGALDIAAALLKVQESDVAADANTLTGGADITASIVGTAPNAAGSTSALPGATADNTFQKFEIDCRGRKRYLKLLFTGGDGSAGTFASAFALLSRAEIAPVTAAQKGCAQVMQF